MMNLNTLASLFSQPAQPSTEFTGVCTDSRLIKPGHLFIALRGERFDGHDFIPEVETKGALAVITNRTIPGVRIPQLVVKDTLVALTEMAKAHRATIHCPVIALTGSNGKTTVKEMIASILPTPSLATKGNLNNHIGVPLSVLELTGQHRYAVFELGANHAKEIAHTVAIVRPQVSLINNIAPAHVEGFGSIEGVARAKGEIHQGLSDEGTAIINDDDAYAHFWDDILVGKKTLHFSLTKGDICAKGLYFDAQGYGHFSLVMLDAVIDIDLQVPGKHNVRNALAAAACCYAVGIPIEQIQKGLNAFSGVKGRMTVIAGKNQCTVIDDTYNANLRSTLAALEVLAERPGKKIVVFGDMGELGAYSDSHHQEVGLVARDLGIDTLMSCGSHSELASKAFGSQGQHFTSKEELVAVLLKSLSKDVTVLVKGSRSSAMEKIVHQLV